MNLERSASIVFLVVTASYLLTIPTFYANSLEAYGTLYMIRYYYPKVLPFFIFALYLANNGSEATFLEKEINTICWGGFTLSLVSLSLFFYGISRGIPSTAFTGVFVWSYTALIEWNVAFVLGFALVYLKTKNVVASTCFGALIISAGGLIYELPAYHVVQNYDIYFHSTYPLFIATKWFSLVFLAYLLYRVKWKLNFTFFITCWFYVMFSVAYMMHPFRFFPVWMPRLVTIIMLLTLPSGFATAQVDAKDKSPL